MDEFRPSSVEIPPVKEFDQMTEWSDQLSPMELHDQLEPYFSVPEGVGEQPEVSNEYINEREFGLHECVESAKGIFTKEVISEWKKMSLEQRNIIIQKYEQAVAKSLKIEPGRVYFLRMPETSRGFNNGDGNVYLNADMLGNPKNIIQLIDTVAHEARHQFQREAVANPDKYGISPEVVKEWAYGLRHYTTCGSTQYDPWGYHYNPVEMDARYFGEAVVREVTKDLINDLRK